MSLPVPKFGNLQGLKVLCAGGALAGPHGAVMFAENGAEVIHIEDTRSKDVSRAVGDGYLYAMDHRNVLEMSLAIPTPEGKKVLERLVKRSDVLLECNKGGTFEKWGLTDEVLWGMNSKLVIVHVSGFGQTGDPAYVNKGSYDSIGQAFGGYAVHNGTVNTPMAAKPVTCDHMTGLSAAMATMFALYRVQQTGVGESVDVTQYETVLRAQQFQAALGFTEGVEAERYEGMDVRIAGDAFYKCKDGKYVTIFVAGQIVTARCVKLLGLGSDYDGMTLIQKRDGELADRFVNALRKFTAEHTSDEIDDICTKNAIPCTKLMTYKDMLENSHYAAREDIIEYYSPNLKKTIKAPATFPKFKKNPQQIWRGAVDHGEDNEIILKEIGYDDKEIEALYASACVTKL